MNESKANHICCIGQYQEITAKNYGSHAACLGRTGKASAFGDFGNAASLGQFSSCHSHGMESNAACLGAFSRASTVCDNTIAAGLGYQSKVSSKEGWIVLVDWQNEPIGLNRVIKRIFAVEVGNSEIDGVPIEPDTWYWFDSGKLHSEQKKPNK